jgi:hypothetical protein
MNTLYLPNCNKSTILQCRKQIKGRVYHEQQNDDSTEAENNPAIGEQCADSNINDDDDAPFTADKK